MRLSAWSCLMGGTSDVREQDGAERGGWQRVVGGEVVVMVGGADSVVFQYCCLLRALGLDLY